VTILEQLLSIVTVVVYVVGMLWVMITPQPKQINYDFELEFEDDFDLVG